MRTILNNFSGFAFSALLVAAMASCVSETPFSDDGEVLVKMNVLVNPSVTRAVPDDNQALRDNCVIYVSNSQGLLHKWKGADKVPEQLYMRYGNYVAEAWSGDSVTAAYASENKKFYKGREEFTVSKDASNLQVTLSCTLANVVASVDESTIKDQYVKDVVVTFSNTRGSLSFDSEKWSDKGYFMMPNGDSELEYVVTGKNNNDKEFTKKGVISNVQSAHEYRLSLDYNPKAPTDGGSFIEIKVDETEVLKDEVVSFFGKPQFHWDEADVEVGGQIVGIKGEFKEHKLRIAAYGSFSSVWIRPTTGQFDENVLPKDGDSQDFNLVNVNQEGNGLKNKLEEKGIKIEYIENDDAEAGVKLCKYALILTETWLNSLPESETAYEMTVVATDGNGESGNGKSNETVISIANTKKAIVQTAPVIVDADELKNDFTAIGAKYVNLPISYEDDADLTNIAIQYRVADTNDWKTQEISLTRATVTESVSITGLEPGTTYEYRTVGGEIVNGEYEKKSKIDTFTTESTFTIPNASFEDWSTYSAQTMLGKKNVTFPGTGNEKEKTFWDSGNEGAATANMTLTDKSTDMVHSGTYSAKLSSNSAMGVIAAGNIFVGSYVKTDGTNGVLSVGREYNGSHPSKVSVWANYRPGGNVTVKNENKEFLPAEFDKGNDHGQIYVALTSEPVELRTNPSNRKLFNSSDQVVVAYGEVTWTENFGADNQLEKVEIKLKYNENAKTVKPTHLVIVASASKYGDFFSGSASSVMYLDDFELVYE